jgi:DNA-binding Lrp family transcriptional regulator
VRSFILVKTKPGKERDVLERFRELSEVREIHLVTGKFDLLVALESPETELDPRRRVIDLIVERVRKTGNVIDTRTIIPIESETHPPQPARKPRTRGFVFIQSEAGKEKALMKKLLENPEISGVHLLFGKADLLAELDIEKSIVLTQPQYIANIVQTKISKLSGVRDTDTFAPVESFIK